MHVARTFAEKRSAGSARPGGAAGLSTFSRWRATPRRIPPELIVKLDFSRGLENIPRAKGIPGERQMPRTIFSFPAARSDPVEGGMAGGKEHFSCNPARCGRKYSPNPHARPVGPHIGGPSGFMKRLDRLFQQLQVVAVYDHVARSTDGRIRQHLIRYLAVLVMKYPTTTTSSSREISRYPSRCHRHCRSLR